MALKGIQVLELAGLAPGPFCGMIMADFGASVIVVDRVGPKLDLTSLTEGKASLNVDLKSPKGQKFFRKMVKKSDVLIEPFRPGVMERLNLGPDNLLSDNPRLVYARLTGYGQTGPFRSKAGHDINYVSLSGLLSMFGWRSEQPSPPINFAADFAGGGVMCALGIMMALFERERSGIGQVVDASMVEGTAYVGSWFLRTLTNSLIWGHPRGKNLLDGGSFFYDVYKTKDDKWMAVGALEPQFYSSLLDKLGISEESLPQTEDFQKGHAALSAKFSEKTQTEWCEIFDGNDDCVTPVLTPKEALHHPHNVARNSFAQLGEQIVPNPAPKLSRTSHNSSAFKEETGKNCLKSFVSNLGVSDSELSQLISDGVVELSFRSSKM